MVLIFFFCFSFICTLQFSCIVASIVSCLSLLSANFPLNNRKGFYDSLWYVLRSYRSKSNLLHLTSLLILLCQRISFSFYADTFILDCNEQGIRFLFIVVFPINMTMLVNMRIFLSTFSVSCVYNYYYCAGAVVVIIALLLLQL